MGLKGFVLSLTRKLVQRDNGPTMEIAGGVAVIRSTTEYLYSLKATN